MLAILTSFAVGSLILLFSTEYLVSFAKRVSFALKISPLVVGLTLVAIGTSLPELSLSMTAIYKNDVGLAMGNIVGSNVVNILFVFAIGILAGKLRVGTSKTQRNAVILTVTSVIFVILQLSAIPARLSGIILLTMSVAITFLEYILGVSGRDGEDKKMFAKQHRVKIGASALFMPIILVIGIIVGSSMVVASAEEFSVVAKISTTLVGLSLTAVVTSLPELLTTILSQKEHQAKLTLGNILGSNIYNLLLIGGLINLLYGKVGAGTKGWVEMLASTLIFIFIIKKFEGQVIPKKYGFALLLLFFIYLASLGV